MSTTPLTATHLLIHRYTPGTGPQEGTAELDAEMKEWAQIDQHMRATGQLVAGWALHNAAVALGPTPDQDGMQTVFAVHAISASSEAEAEQIAARMPHLGYGSTEVRATMPNPLAG